MSHLKNAFLAQAILIPFIVSRIRNVTRPDWANGNLVRILLENMAMLSQICMELLNLEITLVTANNVQLINYAFGFRLLPCVKSALMNLGVTRLVQLLTHIFRLIAIEMKTEVKWPIGLYTVL